VNFVFCEFGVFGVFGAFLGGSVFVPLEIASQDKVFFYFPEQECFWGCVITESYLKHRKSAFLGARGGSFGGPGGPRGVDPIWGPENQS